MNSIKRFWRASRSLAGAILLIFTFSFIVAAQGDMRRQTVAITYPLDQTITVNFRGTTRLPRVSGTAKVKRTGRRGTRVELSIENLPRASELGGIYTTYVLWAISPEGRTDNLGEVKRSGSMIIDSKADVTTPLQTFALILTAEPHFLVRGPSRMVVLENLPPRKPGDAEVATINVQYIGNTSDYFEEARLPDVADRDYTRTPTSLLGARQAVNLARYARAERFAPEELKEASAALEAAENAWRLKSTEAEIDQAARRATSLAARAEEVAEARRAAAARREEISRRDTAVREAEANAATATKQIAELRAALLREQQAHELSERDLANANQQVRELRAEVARLRDEVNETRRETEEAKIKLARLEGERAAEEARRSNEQKILKQRETAQLLKQNLARYGTVRETERGLVLVLPETLWSGARLAEFSGTAQSTLEPLTALLANHAEYKVVIEAHTDNRGDAASLQQLTQARAQKLAEQFIQAGIDSARIEANGMGAGHPVAPNTKPSGRLRNRRTELTLTLADSPNTIATSGN